MAAEDWLAKEIETDYQKLTELSFVAKEEEILKERQRYLNGEIKKGVSTGFKELDEFWLFKEETFVIWLGHDNVGKSVVLWYLTVVSNVLHGWKWIIYSTENRLFIVYMRIIEFKYRKDFDKLTEREMKEAHDWFLDNFTLISNKDVYDCPRLISNVLQIQSRRKHKGFLIDPYNSLPINKTMLKGIGEHTYHYEMASNLRLLCTREKISVYVSCHAVTEALRQRHGANETVLGYNVSGLPKPPHKSDAEGGGKWSNRADDFVTVHRYTQHPELWKKTLFIVRKIKEVETGGRPTTLEPVALVYDPIQKTFTDSLGTSPFIKRINHTDELPLDFTVSKFENEKPPF